MWHIGFLQGFTAVRDLRLQLPCQPCMGIFVLRVTIVKSVVLCQLPVQWAASALIVGERAQMIACLALEVMWYSILEIYCLLLWLYKSEMYLSWEVTTVSRREQMQNRFYSWVSLCIVVVVWSQVSFRIRRDRVSVNPVLQVSIAST